MSSNMANFFRTQFLAAHQATLDSRFVEADRLCHDLLREPTLPMLYRAGCNLMLCFGDDNPVEFATEAVKWYQEMYDEVQDDPTDGPHHLALLQQAQDALARAQRRVNESSDDTGEDEEDTREQASSSIGDLGSSPPGHEAADESSQPANHDNDANASAVGEEKQDTPSDDEN